ncbi:hypothetical protein LPB19_15375 [Marinobacter salinisoli]|uniref:YhdP central domain-containing protein n=1 Tax=Marinobacter salinisoli TaxID=2769486 RepID=A0ABX7MQD1_9GAMM|nr:AsmA-like C-terminal region-containing protein [Marinobacter salinisoli]QSP94537.1 hypothetical protein LPB19_15375 [Marinobacter salinisoli]
MSATGDERSSTESPPEKPSMRLAARLSSAVWWLLLFVLVLFALYAGLGRQLTSNIDSYTADLATELSARLGHPVSIGQLSSRWFWLDPSFTARDVVINKPDSDQALAQIEYLRVRFDFLSSLLRWRVVFEDFEVDGVELALSQTGAGDLDVQGPELTGPVNSRLSQLLRVAGQWLSEPYVKVTRLSLALQDREGEVRHLDVPQLDLVYRQGLFRASGRAIKSGTAEQLASFSLVGRQFFRGDFTGQLYLDVQSGRLFDELVDDYEWRDLRVEGVDLGGEAWLTFQGGEVQQINGRLNTPYLQLSVRQESLAPIEDIQARFGWRRANNTHPENRSEAGAADDLEPPGEWHLQQLQWRWNTDTVSPFSLSLLPTGDGLRAHADALPLGPLQRLLSALPVLPDVATSALANYRPEGFLDRVTLELPADPQASFQFGGQLRNVRIQAHNGAPSMTGLAGQLWLDREHGYVQIESADEPIGMAFPKLYSAGWLFPELKGRVIWQTDENGFRVFSDDLTMHYGEQTHFAGAFKLALQKDVANTLELDINVQNGTEETLYAFLPDKTLNANLYDWLTEAIQTADNVSGYYRGGGQIGARAEQGSFVSSMAFDFDRATVAYSDRWPVVSGAKGRVVVKDGLTDVTLQAGRTGGLSLEPSTVTVGTENDESVVRVNASAQFPGKAVGFWLSNSPLGEMVSERAAELEIDGTYDMALDLALPLGETAEPRVDVQLKTVDGTVRYPDADLVWKKITGELGYNSDTGISGLGLSATFLGQPVEITIASAGNDSGLSIRQWGRVPVASLFRLAGADEGSNFGVSGIVSYAAELEMGDQAEPGVRIRSGLRGVALDWPGTLAKTADEVAPLKAYIRPAADGELSIDADWENRAAFSLLLKNSGLDLTLKHVYLKDQRLENVQLEATSLGDRWVIDTRSERLVGRVVIPDNDSVVEADLDVLRLRRDEKEEGDATSVLTLEEQLEAFRSLGMGEWPDIDATIADLRLGDESLGAWSFRLRPESERLIVEGMEGRLNSLTLRGDMTWSILGGREATQFAGQIAGGALTDLGPLLGYDVPLTNETTHIDVDFDWPGRPDEFSVERLSGSVQLRLDEGVILEQNNTAQLFRVFNLLNADTLWRRLKLDFSDLYERGVAFDAVSGQAQINQGLLTLDPELQVVGPSGAFKVTGATNMALENLDMKLVVVLPLTQNLPLAALLMGAGAPIGGALFVLDKVLGDPLSKLTSATYRVSGTWEQPEVKLQRVFDTGQ